ncbi:uncharacterized protein LOC123558624 [Mercenaria mercenaria]|uniref:uncharacterized protein LOC123558624 n=1 Tax=Mercenaria mercenaria TaxID=6596 RepID=UPI00234F981C|nr:uncharacterized protein LOC123558624 [Mercenaria mercenaria]
MAIQFSYISIGGTSTSLHVNFNEQQRMVPVDIREHWVLSDCYDLPEDFEGEIVIGIGNEETEAQFVAIDNVKLVEITKCTGPSLSCDFTSGNTCNYNSPGDTWKLAETLMSTGSGTVRAPPVLLSTSYCYGFLYSVKAVDSVDELPTLYLYRNEKEIWKTDGNTRSGNSTVQITLEADVTDLYFQSEGKGSYMLFETYIQEGICKDLSDCTGFICGDRCISAGRKCDRTVDCVHGEDEDEALCGNNTYLGNLKPNLKGFSTGTNLERTGFRTSDSSYVEWKLESNATVTVNDTEKFISSQSLITRFATLLARPSILESFEYHLEEDSCLQINYFGDVPYGKIQLIYGSNADKDAEIFFYVSPSADVRHISVPVTSGNVRLLLYVYMFDVRNDHQGSFPDSSVFVVKQIIMHAGRSCDKLTIECPNDAENVCLDKRSCYSDAEKCNTVSNCFDESDEMEDCGYKVVCDFEHPVICGYVNISPRRTYIDYRQSFASLQTVWERIASSSITRPTTDHTFQISGEGHFLTSKNNEGLIDRTRYVDVETMQSPYETFEDDGCITFWYYLNSTEHQPKTTSAQIFVYIQYEDTGEKLLLWYDHINRPFVSWVKGGVAVYGNRPASLIVTAKTSIPFDGFTGVVSFDDVAYSVGNCHISKLNCDADMHQCTEGKICIPDSFVCDGEADCQDRSDERFCDRPNGSLKLIGGDRSYGKLAYFYDRAWRPVCYPETDDEQNLFKLNTAHHVCRELGFIGNSDSFKYKLWEKYSATNIELYCSDDHGCQVNMTSAQCDQYAYIRCSNEVCFSDEVVCPGTRSTCVPRSFICDGQQDCPNNMDETTCYCYKDETKCTHTVDECNDKTCETCEERGMFECFDHECVLLTQRCDGKRDCGDASDEYRCVQIEDNFEVSVFMNSTLTRETVCVDDVRFEEADLFCQMAGQGDVAEISSGFERRKRGINPVTFEPMTNCFPLRLKCSMPECGTTMIQDNFIQPFVINGRDASIEEWPWYGHLRLNGTFICGLSLIDPLWAITASHCFGRYSFHVVYTVSFGTDSTGSDGEWHQEIPVQEMFEYGYITSPWLVHDITLLKLKYPALINNFTRPVCMPTMTSLNDIRTQGPFAECFVIGLGTSEKLFADPTSADLLPDVLQKKQVQVLTKEYCTESWTPLSLYPDSFPENVVCVGTESPSSPVCFGDSGGPLVCKANSGRWELFGLVSFGYRSCFHDLIPTVLTSVANYREWIKDVTGLKLGQ